MGIFDEAARPLSRTAFLAPGDPNLQLLPRTRAWFELNLMTDAGHSDLHGNTGRVAV